MEEIKQRLKEIWLKIDIALSKNQFFVIIALVSLVVLVALFNYFKTSSKSTFKVDKLTAQPVVQTGAQTQKENQIIIQIAGAVKKPNVYSVDDGSRLNNLIKKAGGFIPSADQDSLNLAQKLIDGQKIYVPKKGEKPPGQPAQASDGKININSATAEDLDKLPGIGPTLADKILSYRKEVGSFKSVDELSKVNGIGVKKFADIKDKVTI